MTKLKFYVIATEAPPPGYNDHNIGASSCVGSPIGSSVYSGGGCGPWLMSSL